MSWLRIDDGFTEHRKIVELKRAERWTWLEVLTYCARQGSGTIPAGVSDVLKHVNKTFLDRCKELGLVDVVGGEMEVHDWAAYNPKDPTKAERQARWRQRKQTEVDGDVDASVDTLVDDGVDESERLPERLRDEAPRAGTRARPVPSPPPTPSGSSSVSDNSIRPASTSGGRTESETEEEPVHLGEPIGKDIPW